LSIQDKFGKTIFEHEDAGKRAQSAEASFLISSMLSDQQARAPTFNSLNIPGRSVAVKTGTTNDNKDAWTIGYTPSIAVGVWVGNNANRPMSGVAGAGGAGPIWRGTMLSILQGKPAETFSVPANIERVQVCSANGRRAASGGAGTYTEYFIRGTTPSATCNQPRQEEKKEEKKDDKKDEDEEEVVAPKPTTKPTPVVAVCADGKDNDGDGFEDLQDPGCATAADTDEADEPATTPPPPAGGGTGATTPPPPDTPR
jgi:membrane carboxypeptidase/penicillin-binding protein